MFSLGATALFGGFCFYKFSKASNAYREFKKLEPLKTDPKPGKIVYVEVQLRTNDQEPQISFEHQELFSLETLRIHPHVANSWKCIQERDLLQVNHLIRMDGEKPCKFVNQNLVGKLHDFFKIELHNPRDIPAPSFATTGKTITLRHFGVPVSTNWHLVVGSYYGNRFEPLKIFPNTRRDTHLENLKEETTRYAVYTAACVVVGATAALIEKQLNR